MIRRQTVCVTEIVELLGVTPPASRQARQRAGLPKPVGREGQSRLWDRREVVAWAKVCRQKKTLALVADQRSRFG